ncbi:MAG: DUF3806 domain-containing protein [Pseudomonadales bacterium]|nr:DUF3806 domain-containing protein [Halioglobus sp.]MCP5131695.1 DUF3806 domain-containing protein [Pseudomonadales bacterium]
MSPAKFTGWLLAVVTALLVAVSAAAQPNLRISEPSNLDRQYMDQQRALLQDLATSRLGRSFTGTRANDLEILQLLLDRGLVRPDQTRELQAMGVIMGDLLAAELNMHWVIYEDAQGRSRALRYKETDEYLFPITMISRRREVGNQTPVIDIYQKAYDLIAPLTPALPFS